MKFAFIHARLGDYPVTCCCKVLQVSRSGYYAWLRRPTSSQQQRRAELADQIREVHQSNRGVYGSPRVYQVLRAQGQKVCENTVAKIMRHEGLQAKAKRKFQPQTTDSSHDKPVAENILDRQFTAEEPNRKWVTDITYIWTLEGWLYLAAVMDLCSRKIVGWSMADHMRAELVIDALMMAVSGRTPPPHVLHHSDRGSQYASDAYQGLLNLHGMTVSMSGKGDCWDNATMESFWGTLKTELVHHENYATRAEAQSSIFEYIEVFYNRTRLHSTLGYLSPEQFEASRN